MKSISMGSFAGEPPAASALSASSSTCSRLSVESARMASVCVRASATFLLVKSLNRSATSSITNASSFTTMQVAVSSVNRWSNEKPSSVKNFTAPSRFPTGRFTKIFGAVAVAIAPPAGRVIEIGGRTLPPPRTHR
jgi:hypothetical protein